MAFFPVLLTLVPSAPERIGPITAPLDKRPSHRCITVTTDTIDTMAAILNSQIALHPLYGCRMTVTRLCTAPDPPNLCVSSLLATYGHQWTFPTPANRLLNATGRQPTHHKAMGAGGRRAKHLGEGTPVWLLEDMECCTYSIIMQAA
ncbi:hypothetical protein NPX13_g8506 [Xylaria arbuscula]|uniref:Uncharacterized protein n=1 Tax=Xylaria arbuscula TaxID=114810 RepID=A0A9W8TK33_9PEZI|nr:hypothetical protein NPX13_g8506 [Xylaria arbuscula]